MISINSKYLYNILAALLSGCFFLCACENDVKKIDDLTKKVVMKEEVLNVNSQLSQNGKIRAVLKAPIMWRVYADTLYVEFPKTLHCTKAIETFLDCKYGKYLETYNKVFLKDSVVVIGFKGDTLRTPELWWDQNTKMFYTDKPSEYIAKDRKLYPQYGIEATQDFKRVTFKQPTGVIQMKEGMLPQ
jgi:hypothetical protein